MSLSYDYRYVSTEERAEYIKANADERTYNAYSKLTDGAAQADFWRIFTLYNEGGVYMDIDGHLVWCLKDTLDIIIDNIEQRRIDGGVFVLTGPTTLNQALEGKQVNSRRDKLTCTQGTFTNEYFQYMDKKRGKWNHTKNEDLLK